MSVQVLQDSARAADPIQKNYTVATYTGLGCARNLETPIHRFKYQGIMKHLSDLKR